MRPPLHHPGFLGPIGMSASLRLSRGSRTAEVGVEVNGFQTVEEGRDALRTVLGELMPHVHEMMKPPSKEEPDGPPAGIDPQP